MTFSDAVRSGFQNYATFQGRSSRAAFWWWFLFQLIVEFVAGIIDFAAFNNLGVFYGLAALALLLPSLAVGVRRLHDTNRTGWWLLLYIIPVIGFIVLLVFFLSQSDPGPNQYGPAPDATPPIGADIPPPPPPPPS